MHNRIVLEVFEKSKCSGIAVLQSSRCVSNEQPCLKTIGLYDDLLLLLICFTCSISYLLLPFHLVYLFQFLCLFLFFVKPLWSVAENLLHTYTYSIVYAVCLVAQLCPTLCNPMDCSSPGSSVHGDSPGKNTEVSCHALLQGIFPTQGSNQGLPNCRQILYYLSHQGSPSMCNIIYIF